MAPPNQRQPQAASHRPQAVARSPQSGASVAQAGTGAGVSAARAEAQRIETADARAEAAVAADTSLLARKAVAPFRLGPVKPVRLRKINIEVYGPYGHGKTTFAASALDVPEMRDVIFIAAEPGDMSLTNRRDLDIVIINRYDQLARIFEFLVLHCKWRDEYLSPSSTPDQKAHALEKLIDQELLYKSEIIPVEDQIAPVEEGRTWFEEQRLRTGKPLDEPYLYRTAIIDSLSEAHKYLVYKFTGVDIGKTKLDEEIERMEEWQVAQEMFRLLIRSFRDLPMNTIFVCAEAIEPAERNKKRNPHAGQALPKLAGAMAADVAGFIDIVGYLMREIEPGGETHRYLYLGAGYEGWISKHRFENLPDLEYLEDPTLTQLIALARKDEDLNGASQPSSSRSTSSTVTPSRNAASTAAANRSRPANAPAGSRSGSGNGVRRPRR